MASKVGIANEGSLNIMNSEFTMDLNAILSPFLNWMEIFGVRPCPPKGSKFRWFCWFFHRWVCLLLTIAVLTFNIFYFKCNTKDIVASLSISKNPTKTFSWNVFIDYVNTIVHILSAHLSLFFILFKNWNGLQDALHQLSNCFNSEYKVKFRKISIIGIIYIILLVSMFT